MTRSEYRQLVVPFVTPAVFIIFHEQWPVSNWRVNRLISLTIRHYDDTAGNGQQMRMTLPGIEPATRNELLLENGYRYANIMP